MPYSIIWRRERDYSGHPALRPVGAACAALRRSNSLPANLSNPARLWLARVLIKPRLCQIANSPHTAGILLSGGERGIRTLDGLFKPILP